MASRNAQLAEAVKTALNATTAQAGFVQTFTATRRAVPLTDLEQLRTLTVTVIAAGDEGDRNARDSEDHELTVYVGIEKVVDAVDVSSEAANAEIDQLLELTEQVSDFFGSATVSESVGLFLNSTIRTLADPSSLLTQNTFRSVVQVTFVKVVED